ncbi:MAG: nuclear transport factor 2 family protein [Patulibacter sp.]|nr:nuclear transport factor 2 family protein [Patulibacter sp.]
MHPFRTAVEARDLDAVRALLAEDVVFRSPVAFQPYHGKPIVGGILEGVMRVFENFHYVQEIGAEGAREHVLVFKAQIDGREIHGADFLTTDADGQITELTVMVRPLSAANVLAERMAVEFQAVMEALPAPGEPA